MSRNDFGLRFGEPKQIMEIFQMVDTAIKSTMPPRNKKNFRSTKSGAGMTKAGVADIEEKILALN